MVDSGLDIQRGSADLLPTTMTGCCFARCTILLACLGMPLLAGHQVPPEKEKLGNVHFPVSCGLDAQRQFDRALTMLHSFVYPQGLEAFTQLATTNPDCAMAYWGIAVSARANPLVGSPDAAALERGSQAVEKAKAAGAPTPRERDYIAAIDAYYHDWQQRDYPARVLAYEAAMEEVYRRYPDDDEAALFYALAIDEAVTVLPADKNYARPRKAGQILERVLAAQPDHPGVLHYLIHTYDFPSLAARALPAAKRYAQVAPSAPHALHMPSHVFSMLGMWPESIRSNQASLGAAKTYVHAMDFMVYAYLQGAQDREAKRLVDESAALLASQAPPAAHSPTGGVLAVHTAFAAIPARYALERGQWAEARALSLRPSYPAADAITYFARAIGAARTGDEAGGRKEIEHLRSAHTALTQSRDVYWAEQVAIQRLAAEAWVSYATGKKSEALKQMQAAADREDASEKHVAMENRLWPMRELLGELLLALNRPAEALRAFELSLKAAPNRFRGVYGAARAAERLGNRAQARRYYEKLDALSSRADTDRPEVAKARAFLGRER
jgi:tetratricopeptide (TPR) repeat protein